MRENRCVVCGAIIPEGRMVCPSCENMTEVIINIDTIDKVKEFCNLCSKCTGEVSVRGDIHIVSGKSMMGLLSLNLTKPVTVIFDDDTPYEIREGIKNFIVG